MLNVIRVREAVAAGWSFPHYEKDSYRAEKYVNGKLVNEWAENLTLLLDRIEAYEADHQTTPAFEGPAEGPLYEASEADQTPPLAADGGEATWGDPHSE